MALLERTNSQDSFSTSGGRRQSYSLQFMQHRPPPYLDVLTIQPRRLLSMTSQELAMQDPPSGQTQDRDVQALLASVKLLVEPIQVPDLQHTGLLDSLPKAKKAASTLPRHHHEEQQSDVKLFYPSGVKNANMREFIKDTIQRHMEQTQSCPELHTTRGSVVTLEGADSIKKAALHKKSTSPIKRTTGKKAKAAARNSESPAKSPMLNPELARQAKEVLAELRKNSSKINELLTS